MLSTVEMTRRTIEEVVVLLTGRFGDQQAAVAGRAVEEPAFVLVLGGMLGTDRVVGAESTQVDCRLQMPSDLTPGLDEAAQRALGVGRAGVEQDAVAELPA